LDLEKLPQLQTEVLKPSTIFNIGGGRKVGVIGYLTPETAGFVLDETIEFFDEIEMIK
jgi:2',3'-cyclic-nucleotide 2'-phosphodiesterase (5'-nucleotidase family)